MTNCQPVTVNGHRVGKVYRTKRGEFLWKLRGGAPYRCQSIVAGVKAAIGAYRRLVLTGDYDPYSLGDYDAYAPVTLAESEHFRLVSPRPNTFQLQVKRHTGVED